MFAVGSLGCWIARKRVVTRGIEDADQRTIRESLGDMTDLYSAPLPQMLRDIMVAFVVLVYVAMGAYVMQAALLRPDMSADVQRLWPWALVWTLLAGAAALLIPYAQLGAAKLRHDADASAGSWTPHMRDVLLLLAIAPLAVLITFAVASILDRHPIVGPDPASWFRQIGWDVCYGVPLVVIALTLIGHAIRDRSSRFAFAAGLLFNAVATMVVLIRLARGGGTLDAIAWIVVAQVNARRLASWRSFGKRQLPGNGAAVKYIPPTTRFEEE